MKGILFILVLMVVASCSSYKRGTFLADNTTPLKIVVPKGYNKETTEKDSAGNAIRFYRYGNGASFYIAQLRDSATVQPIDKDNNIPKQYPQGVWLYKGLDSSGRYWRESQLNNYRFGYKNVPAIWEVRFDSAVNYATFHKLRSR